MDRSVDFSVVILQLLHRMDLQQSGEARVILQLEAVRRSVLCRVVKLAEDWKKIKRPTQVFQEKLLKISKSMQWALFGRWPRSDARRSLLLTRKHFRESICGVENAGESKY